MPKGYSIPNMMDNEVVALVYTCLKCNEGNVNFQQVATILSFRDATFARNRLQRVMKAQGRPGTQAGQGVVEDKKAKGSPAKSVTPTKKRKVDVKEEVESEKEEEETKDDSEDAKQLHRALDDFGEGGEKV